MLAAEIEATAVSAKLAELGGSAEVFNLAKTAVADLDAVAPEVEAAESSG